MSIAYYANKATEAFWSDYWQQTQLNQLLKVAARDPLTQHFKRHLPKSGLILEGGCGLGQYVLFFQQQGYRIIGGDFSLPALQAHQKVSGNSPLVGLDLCHMACPDNTFQAHISIGVIEHYAFLLWHKLVYMVLSIHRKRKDNGLVCLIWILCKTTEWAVLVHCDLCLSYHIL